MLRTGVDETVVGNLGGEESQYCTLVSCVVEINSYGVFACPGTEAVRLVRQVWNIRKRRVKSALYEVLIVTLNTNCCWIFDMEKL